MPQPKMLLSLGFSRTACTTHDMCYRALLTFLYQISLTEPTSDFLRTLWVWSADRYAGYPGQAPQEAHIVKIVDVAKLPCSCSFIFLMIEYSRAGIGCPIIKLKCWKSAGTAQWHTFATEQSEEWFEPSQLNNGIQILRRQAGHGNLTVSLILRVICGICLNNTRHKTVLSEESSSSLGEAVSDRS